MGKRSTGIAIALACAAGVTVVAQQSSSVLQVNVTRDGVPAANVQIDMQLLNQGKVSGGATGATGDLALALSMVNAGKATRVQVAVYDCPNDRSFVVFVEAGAVAPEDSECRRRMAGWLWFGRARAVTIDVARGTMQVQGGQSFFGTTTGRLIAGGGAVLIGAAALTAGGNDSSSAGNPPSGQSGTQGGTSFTPSGTYPVTNAVASDPGGHRLFVLMEDNTVLTVVVTGTAIRITCPPGSKWTEINGTITNGQITGEGRGTAAGFSNVLYRFTGTLALTGSSQGTLAGSLTIGAGGEFPGGQPIVYNVSGRKQ